MYFKSVQTWNASGNSRSTFGTPGPPPLRHYQILRNFADTLSDTKRVISLRLPQHVTLNVSVLWTCAPPGEKSGAWYRAVKHDRSLLPLPDRSTTCNVVWREARKGFDGQRSCYPRLLRGTVISVEIIKEMFLSSVDDQESILPEQHRGGCGIFGWDGGTGGGGGGGGQLWVQR